MAEMDSPVERAYLVSVHDLRGICDALTDRKREYRLTTEDEKQVAIFYNDGPDDLNAVCFTFPIIVNLNVQHAVLLRLFGKEWPFGEDGLMVCLHVYTGKQIRQGLYFEQGKLYWDSSEDWEKFWGPLKAALIQRWGRPSRRVPAKAITGDVMDRIPAFNPQQLTAISKVLGDTAKGLTGLEIGHLLRDCKIPDVSPEMTKWKRLFNAFACWQNEKQLGNCVLMFISRAMNPVQYTANPNVFADRRDELNVVLAFCGMTIGEDGQVRRASVAHDLDDAMERARRLQGALANRKVHEDVLKFCRAELLDQNYFHAVFEAMKSVAVKIRTLSGLTSDGADLVQEAFALGKAKSPILAINNLSTETDEGEQRGFVNLLVGLFGTIRNPLAHNPKIEWDMSEQDTLDILTTASLIHRKLDQAYQYRNP